MTIDALSVTYGRIPALSSVNLVVREGQVSALVGPNGAGKSTLVDAVTGFLSGYKGSILLEGRPIDSLSAHVRALAGIRRSFQQSRIIPDFTVGQYVALAARRSMSTAELDELTAWMQCPPADARIEDIDVGARRLVEVLGIAASRPRISLLDEPGAGLADAQRASLAERIREIPDKFGSAVLLIDHDMELVTAACSTATVLDFGLVISQGSVQECLNDPNVISAYLGEEVAVP